MKKFIIGFLIGLVLGGSLAWAAARITLETGAGVETGTTSNPITINLQ